MLKLRQGFHLNCSFRFWFVQVLATAHCTFSGEPASALQDEENPFDSVDGVDSDHVMGLNRDFFWFKPVASNMAHHSVLGESLCEFDFLAQGFVVKACQFDDGYPSAVTLTEWERTKSVNISHIPFEKLSKSLRVWSDFEVAFTILPSLYPRHDWYMFVSVHQSH